MSSIKQTREDIAEIIYSAMQIGSRQECEITFWDAGDPNLKNSSRKFADAILSNHIKDRNANIIEAAEYVEEQAKSKRQIASMLRAIQEQHSGPDPINADIKQPEDQALALEEMSKILRNKV